MTLRNKIRLGALLLLALALAWSSVYLHPWLTVRLTVGEVDQWIQSGLAEGASVEDVTGFLDARGVDHSEYTEGREPIYNPRPGDPWPDRSAKRYILARIRNVSEKFLSTWDIYIIFYFDPQKRFSSHKTFEIGKGL